MRSAMTWSRSDTSLPAMTRTRSSSCDRKLSHGASELAAVRGATPANSCTQLASVQIWPPKIATLRSFWHLIGNNRKRCRSGAMAAPIVHADKRLRTKQTPPLRQLRISNFLDLPNIKVFSSLQIMFKERNINANFQCHLNITPSRKNVFVPPLNSKFAKKQRQ